jgi:hypothetical protein
LAGSTRNYRKAIDLGKIAAVDLELEDGRLHRRCRLDIPALYSADIRLIEFPVRHRAL